MKLKALIAGLAGIAMFGSAATAADIPVIVPAAPAVVVAPVATGFDWSGIYVGGSVQVGIGIQAGGQVGFNIVRGNFLFGAEGGVGLLLGNAAISVGGAARVGVLLGQNDRLLVYSSVSAGLIPAGPAFFVGGNAGVEIGIGDRISVFGEAGVFGSPGNGCCGLVLRGGINFHL